MVDVNLDRRKKLPQIRRLSSLGSIRREIIRVYEEARENGADPLKVQHARALCFILSSAASVLKDESLQDIENRLLELEKATENKNKE
jgi:hypothetical protein